MSTKSKSRTKTRTKHTTKRAQKPNAQNQETAIRIRSIAATLQGELAPLVRGLQSDAPVGPLRSMLIAICQLEDVAHYIAPELPREAVQS